MIWDRFRKRGEINQRVQLIRMQQPTSYIQMAAQIDNLAVYNRLYSQMESFEVLQQIFLRECEKSHQLLFVSCQILTKKLLNQQLMKKNDQLDVLQHACSLDSQKLSLFRIASKLYEIVGFNLTVNNGNLMQQYLVRSCLNTISVCIYSSINSSSIFEPVFVQYIKMLVPDFRINQAVIKPIDQFLAIVEPSNTPLGPHHSYTIQILTSLLQYATNSTFSQNYYHFRRNLYAFRNNYLMYLVNYGLYCLKSLFKTSNLSVTNILSFNKQLRPALKLVEDIIMYPFNLNMHEFEVEDQIHENISGLQSQIYFPSCFRSLICDTGFLLDLVGYFSNLNFSVDRIDSVREDLYCLIRIIGRVLSTSEYIFVGGQQQKKAFRTLSLQFVTQLLNSNKFFDPYLIICLSKINIKYMSIQNQDEIFLNRKKYFDALNRFILKGIAQCSGRIEDGDKHPYRQLFQMLTAYVNITANTAIDIEAKICAQEALNMLLKVRMVDNQQNLRLMREFGYNNGQEIDCFQEIFSRVPEIFKINFHTNLAILHQLNLDALNNESLTFWLHLASLLLPQHDTTIEQTQLILKFLTAAINARSIASLNFIKTLMDQILYQLKDGISTTYLWTFIQNQKKIKFEQFLLYIIEYSLKILTVPNYALIQNCLSLFKSMFTKLCKHRHPSFIRYFEIIEEVCREIDKTMLVQPQFMKLRVHFFSIISIIWINQGHISFVYRIFGNVRNSGLGLGPVGPVGDSELVGFLRYLTDLTGLLEPVQSSEVYKLLMELIIIDLKRIQPFYFRDPQILHQAFSNEIFLKAFIKFVYTVVNDDGFRMTMDSHSQLPFEIQQFFRPYLIQALKYDYHHKLIDIWVKFLKLNPLGKLLPLQKSFKQKNSPSYKSLIRQYFQNLHRLQNIQQFYYMYTFIEDNIDLMVEWWDQIILRSYKPDVNVAIIANAHIWVNSRQKEHFAKLLYRIAKFDWRYWSLGGDYANQAKYAEWFVANFK